MLFNKKKSKTTATNTISLITLVDRTSPITEQYRTIRTNIHFMMVDKQLKSLVITSAGPGEGKSTTTANLAVVFANSGSRTLLVDADLRKPTVGKTFLLDNSRGFSNLLSEMNLSIDQVTKQSKIDNLSIITSGPKPPNPSELLGSNRMEELLEQMHAKYDIILFDMPPVMAVTDAQLLASKADGTLVVIREGTTKKEEAIKTKKLLELVDANVLGTVYNGTARIADQGYYYYYGF